MLPAAGRPVRRRPPASASPIARGIAGLPTPGGRRLFAHARERLRPPELQLRAPAIPTSSPARCTSWRRSICTGELPRIRAPLTIVYASPDRGARAAIDRQLRQRLCRRPRRPPRPHRRQRPYGHVRPAGAACGGDAGFPALRAQLKRHASVAVRIAARQAARNASDIARAMDRPRWRRT